MYTHPNANTLKHQSTLSKGFQKCQTEFALLGGVTRPYFEFAPEVPQVPQTPHPNTPRG
mgnify:CR=1 FL=1